jgi:hypothetical protein
MDRAPIAKRTRMGTAAGLFAIQCNEAGFLLSPHYEWTSSYQEGDSKVISDDWDGQLNHLKDWSFLQEKGSLSFIGEVALQTNLTGALVANANLGFRCASK